MVKFRRFGLTTQVDAIKTLIVAGRQAPLLSTDALLTPPPRPCHEKVSARHAKSAVIERGARKLDDAYVRLTCGNALLAKFSPSLRCAHLNVLVCLRDVKG